MTTPIMERRRETKAKGRPSRNPKGRHRQSSPWQQHISALFLLLLLGQTDMQSMTRWSTPSLYTSTEVRSKLKHVFSLAKLAHFFPKINNIIIFGQTFQNNVFLTYPVSPRLADTSTSSTFHLNVAQFTSFSYDIYIIWNKQ